MRRSAIFQSLQQKPEAVARLFRGESKSRENFRLHVAAVNTNRSGAQFDSVQNQIVGFSAATGGIADEHIEVVVMNRSEGMMGGVPPVFFLVPLEHRKIRDPKEVEALRIEQAVLVRILLSGIKTELSAGRENGFFRAAVDAAISFAGPSG